MLTIRTQSLNASKKIMRLHRRLSRKEKGSKNRVKACVKLACKYARIAHVRRDALHKGTSLLTRAALSSEEHAARKAEITASLLEPKTKVKARKGKRFQLAELPPWQSQETNQVPSGSSSGRVKRLWRGKRWLIHHEMGE